MRIGKWAISVLLVTGLAVVGVAQEKGGEDISGPYELVRGWPQPACGEGWTWGSSPAVFAESPDRIYVFQRGCLPEIEGATGGNGFRAVVRSNRQPKWEHMLLVFDGNGKLLEDWSQHNDKFVSAHRVLISPYDPERHVWLIDHSGHQVMKFTHHGEKLVMKLGEKGVPGDDRNHFNRPSDMWWLPNGDFYITDGYVNTRVVKFSADGEYLMEWGKPGTGPGEFDTVHGIAIDDQGRVYVSDRGNSRIQIFDQNGKYLDEWPNITHPYFLHMSDDQHLWVSDGYTHKILKYDLNGKLLFSWGTFGTLPGALWGPHQISVDRDGDLYVASAQGNRVQKFRPKKGVDAALVVGYQSRKYSSSAGP